MKEFILIAIILSVSFGAYFGMILTVDMKGVKRVIASILIAVLIGLFFSGAFTLEAKQDEEAWSNGYCSCGGAWSLVSIVRVRGGTEKYYWQCSNCNTVIETMSLMNN